MTGIVLLLIIIAAVWLYRRRRAHGRALPPPPLAPQLDPATTVGVQWDDLFEPGEAKPVNAVGEASYRTQIMKLVGDDVAAARAARYPREVQYERSGTFPARLMREPGNRYDPNAVAVVVQGYDGGWYLVGYLDRHDAAFVAQRMDTAGALAITAAARFWWRVRDDAGTRVEVQDAKIGAKLQF